jgi:hypothetical protein
VQAPRRITAVRKWAGSWWSAEPHFDRVCPTHDKIGSMTGSSAELSSLATALDELTTRITAIADGYATSERDELAADLYAVERALTGAQRRLTKVIDADRRAT